MFPEIFGPVGAVWRVERMEAYFDALRAAADRDPAAVRCDPHLARMLSELTAYYEDGRWLQDYCLDELGRLPPGLKRGVLSQDGVWDLLAKLGSVEE